MYHFNFFFSSFCGTRLLRAASTPTSPVLMLFIVTFSVSEEVNPALMYIHLPLPRVASASTSAVLMLFAAFFCFRGGQPLTSIQSFIFHRPVTDLTIRFTIFSTRACLKVLCLLASRHNQSFWPDYYAAVAF